MVTLEDKLNQVAYIKREYFKWKFDLYFHQVKERTEEEFLEHVKRKNINTFLRWERTEEYKSLVAAYLQTKTANDLLSVYDAVIDKAKQGNDKAVTTLLKLQKEINAIVRDAEKTKDVEDDGLEL